MEKRIEYETINVVELETKLFNLVCIRDTTNLVIELNKIRRRCDFQRLMEHNYGCETFIFCVQFNQFNALKAIANVLPSFVLMKYYSKKTGQDALSTAVLSHHNHILQWILNLKCVNIDQRDIMGRTAFFKAVLWTKFGAARILIRYGCDVYICNDQMKSIFDFVYDLNQSKHGGSNLIVPYKLDISGINSFLKLVLYNKV